MTTSTTTGVEPTPAEGQSAPQTGEQQASGPKGPQTKAEAVTRARSEAVTALTKAHRDEFNADIKARVKEYGFDWSPQPTPAEKAAADIARLMAEHGIKAEDLKS